jgi:dTMP kinase
MNAAAPLLAPRGRRAAARFITLEGGEGAGKSTLARGLSARLAEHGVASVVTREPGGSPRAEAIRERLLAGDVAPHGPFAEALMFYAARMDHVDKTIRPALESGRWVICDRFADSTRAYQGALGRLDPQLLGGLERVALDGFRPDLTLILDVPVDVGLARAAARRGAAQSDRFESEGRGFHTRLRRAYLDIAEREPERCIVLDASVTPDALLDLAWDAILFRLKPGRAAEKDPA